MAVFPVEAGSCVPSGPPPPVPQESLWKYVAQAFLQPRCPSCHQTISQSTEGTQGTDTNQWSDLILSSSSTGVLTEGHCSLDTSSLMPVPGKNPVFSNLEMFLFDERRALRAKSLPSGVRWWMRKDESLSTSWGQCFVVPSVLVG